MTMDIIENESTSVYPESNVKLIIIAIIMGALLLIIQQVI